MAKRIVLCLAHSIEERDQLELLHGLGYEVASIGGYVDPAHPHDPKRPGLDVPRYAEFSDAVEAQQSPEGLDGVQGCAQTHVPDRVLEWLGDDGVMIWHHLLDTRLFPQWERLSDWRKGGRGRRIVWRTVGQSVEYNERLAESYRADGLEVVRYSPQERNIPGYCGEDALIRFWKDPHEWCDWTGDSAVVANVTQDMMKRGEWCNLGFYLAATQGLLAGPMGPGSEDLPGGHGQLSYDEMRRNLREARCYLYTGTQPASLTLGLVEALMTGVPVVSIGPAWMTIFPYGPDLFEGHLLSAVWSDDPGEARDYLRELLDNPEFAGIVSDVQRERAIQTFGPDPVGRAWAEFLG